MPTPVSSIRNIGAATEAAFRQAGIATAEEIRALGADAAYRKLLEADFRPHFIGYYALAMGLMGRPWNDCRGAEKAALRARFDTIVAGARGTGRAVPPDLADALNRIGVRL